MCRKVVMVVTAKAKAVVDLGSKTKGIGQREMKDKDREGKRLVVRWGERMQLTVGIVLGDSVST